MSNYSCASHYSTGEFLLPQIIYQGKTPPCYLKVPLSKEWDVWHSANHWSTEVIMKHYTEKIIVSFVFSNRELLNVDDDRPTLAIVDSF